MLCLAIDDCSLYLLVIAPLFCQLLTFVPTFSGDVFSQVVFASDQQDLILLLVFFVPLLLPSDSISCTSSLQLVPSYTCTAFVPKFDILAQKLKPQDLH